MEADWEIEVGGKAPVIEARWPGFVDLRLHPERASQFPEAAELPALAVALAMLNALASPVWTSKCDVWPVVDSAEFDPDELDAPPGCGAHAMGCYVDLLPRRPRPRANVFAACCGQFRCDAAAWISSSAGQSSYPNGWAWELRLTSPPAVRLRLMQPEPSRPHLGRLLVYSQVIRR